MNILLNKILNIIESLLFTLKERIMIYVSFLKLLLSQHLNEEFNRPTFITNTHYKKIKQSVNNKNNFIKLHSCNNLELYNSSILLFKLRNY